MSRQLPIQQPRPAARAGSVPAGAGRRLRVAGGDGRGSFVQPDPEVVALVGRVAARDEAAFEQLVRRFEGPLRRLARRYRLCSADVEDALQFTWLRLWESAAGIREPAAVAGWLATTLRRRCMHLLQEHAAEMPSDDPTLGEWVEACALDDGLEAQERRRALADAIGALPQRHGRLMTLLASDAELSYREVAAVLGVSVGWIGPTRARCLARLREDVGLRAVVCS
jgi:RNA polymerase sigma factor (sigma-70 family)